MGVWKHNGVDTGHFRVLISSSEVQVEKESVTSSSLFYSVKHVYSVHGTNRSLKKPTAYVIG